VSGVCVELRSAAGYRLYGDVVSEELDVINYSQHLRELQNYITQPSQQSSPHCHSDSSSPPYNDNNNDNDTLQLPLLNVRSLHDQHALHLPPTVSLLYTLGNYIFCLNLNL